MADGNPAAIGHNNPPTEAVDPFEGMKVHIEDLLLEAHNWADGTEVETDEQVEVAGRLIADLEAAAKAADALRVEEKRPLDEQIKAIQDKWNVYIADRKNKAPGKVWKAVDAIKAAIKPYLDRKEAERRAEAEAKRLAAEKAAQEAAEAAKAAAASDLAAQEAAEERVAEAQALAAEAKRVENIRTQLTGGARAKGLRKTYTAQIDDPRALLLHYWGSKDNPGVNREPLLACLQQMAQQDVDRKVFTIPGVTVVEGSKL